MKLKHSPGYLILFFLIFLIPSRSVLSASTVDEEKAKSYYEEGVDLSKQRRYDEAIEKLTRAVKLSIDNHKYHQSLFLTYIATRRGPQAVRFYQGLIQEYPKNGTPSYWLGRLYLDSGSLKEAAEEFEKATRLSPKDEHPFISLGHVSFRLGREKEALEAYTQANQLAPRIAVVHIGVGNIYFNKKEYEKAEKEYETALELDPAFPEARYNLGVIYEKKGDISKAVRQWQKLIEDDPNESKARERLARVYFIGEQYRDAVREYATLSQVKQNSPEVFFALGEAAVLLGATVDNPKDRDEIKKMARDAFHRTLELDPKNAQARKYLDRLDAEKPSAKKK